MKGTPISIVTHDTWTATRTYPVSRSRVFAAWADPAIKARWFVGLDGRHNERLKSDFTVGGRETADGTTADGTTYAYDATYQDIVVDERIIMTAAITADGRLISVSLCTVELVDAAGGTRLTYTEQGVYLDGLDRPEWRRRGTAAHLDRLGEVLLALR